MDKETLRKGNDLLQKIKACEDALNCFQWDSNTENWAKPPEDHSSPIWASTNPKIIIEYDGDGREQAELPFILNDELTTILKTHIQAELEKYQSEFNNL